MSSRGAHNVRPDRVIGWALPLSRRMLLIPSLSLSLAGLVISVVAEALLYQSAIDMLLVPLLPGPLFVSASAIVLVLVLAILCQESLATKGRVCYMRRLPTKTSMHSKSPKTNPLYRFESFRAYFVRVWGLPWSMASILERVVSASEAKVVGCSKKRRSLIGCLSVKAYIITSLIVLQWKDIVRTYGLITRHNRENLQLIAK